MKKSLIALAALATVATAAQAQSSVTLYGIVDMGVMSSKTDAANSRVLSTTSGALSTSRWGVRGTEDLGGGTKAGFVLESEIAAGTGAVGGTVTVQGTTTTTNVFNRAAKVSLENASVGSITLGRMDRIEYVAVAQNDPFGAANFGGTVRATYIGTGIIPSGDARLANAILLESPKFAGLQLQYQRELGGQAGDAQKYLTDSVGANYGFGKLKVIATYANIRNSLGGKEDEVTTVGANYDFGVATVYAGAMERKHAKWTSDVKAQYVGVKAPINANVNAMAQITQGKSKGGTEGADSNTWAVGLTYGFSKRTTAYAMYGKAKNDGTSSNATAYVTNLGGALPAAGTDQTAAVIGIRHSF